MRGPVDVDYPPPWAGTVWLAEGLMVFLGRGGPATRHAHHAVQLTWAWGGGVAIETESERLEGPSVAVAGGVPHRLECEADRLVVAMFEPTSPAGSALDAAIGALGAVAVAGRLEQRAPPDGADDIERFVSAALDSVIGGQPTGRVPRSTHVAAAVRYVHAHVGDRPTLVAAARCASISPSRLTHLFSAEMGIPFKRYVGWARFRRTLAEIAGGSSLTAAASAAGFSDSAHLSRSFRRAFGIAPSALAGMDLHLAWDLDEPSRFAAD